MQQAQPLPLPELRLPVAPLTPFSPTAPPTPTSASSSARRRRPPPLAIKQKEAAQQGADSLSLACDELATHRSGRSNRDRCTPTSSRIPGTTVTPQTSAGSTCSVGGHVLTLPTNISPPGSSGDLDIQRIDELTKIAKLGQGASGVVEKHLHVRSGREVAVKMVSAGDIAEPQRKAILLELRTFAKCRNAHIVDFYGAFQHENVIHIALEYMNAGALSDVLEVTKTVPERNLANITWQVLDGLEHLHREMKVIHRDVKPSNLLLSSCGAVKITDFGVSGELQDELAQSNKNTWVGTIYYMSPERVQGHPYKYNSDLWSLGLTIYECLSGCYPYTDSDKSCKKEISFWQLMRCVVEEDVPQLPKDSCFSHEVRDFLSAVLQKEPKRRPSATLLKSNAWLCNVATQERQAEVSAWIAQAMKQQEQQQQPNGSAKAKACVEAPQSVMTTSMRLRGQSPFATLQPGGESAARHPVVGFAVDGNGGDGPGEAMFSSLRGEANPFATFRAEEAGGPPMMFNSVKRDANPFAHSRAGAPPPMPVSSGPNNDMAASFHGGNPFCLRPGLEMPSHAANGAVSSSFRQPCDAASVAGTGITVSAAAEESGPDVISFMNSMSRTHNPFFNATGSTASTTAAPPVVGTTSNINATGPGRPPPLFEARAPGGVAFGGRPRPGTGGIRAPSPSSREQLLGGSVRAAQAAQPEELSTTELQRWEAKVHKIASAFSPVDSADDCRSGSPAGGSLHALPSRIEGVTGPELFLGDAACARNAGSLEVLGIGAVLNCGAPAVEYPPGFSHLEVSCEDAEDYPLLARHLDRCSEFMEQCEAASKGLLVHCVMGLNRSASLAVALLMLHRRVPLLEAVSKVWECRGRSPILTNRSFRRQLVQLAHVTGNLG